MKAPHTLIRVTSIAGVVVAAAIAHPGMAHASSSPFNTLLNLPTSAAPSVPAKLTVADTGGYNIRNLLHRALSQVGEGGPTTLSPAAQKAQLKLITDEENFSKYYSKDYTFTQKERALTAQIQTSQESSFLFNSSSNTFNFPFQSSPSPKSNFLSNFSTIFSNFTRSSQAKEKVSSTLTTQVHTAQKNQRGSFTSEVKLAKNEEKLIRSLNTKNRQELSSSVYGNSLTDENISGIPELQNQTSSPTKAQAKIEQGSLIASSALEFRPTHPVAPSRTTLNQLTNSTDNLRGTGISDVLVDQGSDTHAAQSATSNAISWVFSELGKTYVYGGDGPNVFDCSGLMQWAWEHSGVAIPRTSQQQYAWATPVSLSQLIPGDFVFFKGSGDGGTMTSPGHVGMYIGEGMMIDAPYTGVDVRIDSIWQNNIVGFGEVPISNLLPQGGSGLRPPGPGYITSITSKYPAIMSGSTGVPVLKNPFNTIPTTSEPGVNPVASPSEPVTVTPAPPLPTPVDPTAPRGIKVRHIRPKLGKVIHTRKTHHSGQPTEGTPVGTSKNGNPTRTTTSGGSGSTGSSGTGSSSSTGSGSTSGRSGTSNGGSSSGSGGTSGRNGGTTKTTATSSSTTTTSTQPTTTTTQQPTSTQPSSAPPPTTTTTATVPTTTATPTATPTTTTSGTTATTTTTSGGTTTSNPLAPITTVVTTSVNKATGINIGINTN